jgi:hypothetical protein
MNTKYYSISSNKKQYYCKESSYTSPDGTKSITISFGGKSVYCVVAAWKSTLPTTLYLDRVEFDKGCIKQGTLEHKQGTLEHKQGTQDMVSTALWTIHTLLPTVKTITFTDDSHILCEEGSKLYKLSLALEYSLKYNQTWYQMKFNATLPKSLLETFESSLLNLDKSLDDFTFMIERAPYLKPYESIYKESKSPREFFDKLRKQYGREYCFQVRTWIRDYLETKIGIQSYPRDWYITVDTLQQPLEFSIEPTTNTMRGGTRRKKRRTIIDDEYTSGMMGYYKNSID